MHRNPQKNVSSEFPYYKLTLLGNSAVGKTSIINKIRDIDNNSLNTLPTTSVDIATAQIQLTDKKVLRYIIFDIPGQEKYKSVSFSVIKNSNGVLMVYSIADKRSFEQVVNWVEEMNDNLQDFVWCLIGNKSDLDKQKRVVTYEEGEKLAKLYGVPFYETTIYDSEKPKNSLTTKEVMIKIGELMTKNRLHMKSQVKDLQVSVNLNEKETQNQTLSKSSRCRC